MIKPYNITSSIFSLVTNTLNPAFSRLSLWLESFLCEFCSLLSWNIKLHSLSIRVIRVIDSKLWGPRLRLRVVAQVLLARLRLLILLLRLLGQLHYISYKTESRFFKPCIVMIPAVPLDRC